MYPTAAAPTTGTFVAAQVESLRRAGVGVEVLHLDRRQAGRHVYRGLRKKVKGFVAATDPDVVHVMYGGVMADAVTRAIGDRPVLVSYCGTDLLGGRGNGALDDLALRYGVLASRRAARRADGVIVKSRNLLDALPRSVDDSRVWIVPNGVDLARFHPRDRSESQKTLGWTGARRHVLFPAPAERPEKRFVLAQAAVAHHNQHGDNVELHALSNVPHDDVPVWLNAADVVLLTSAHEGSPNVVKEALACNVPVVSVNVGDVRERIEGVDGCFIADPSPEDISAKLTMALQRREPIEGRGRVADLSLEGVADRVRTIYATLSTSTS